MFPSDSKDHAERSSIEEAMKETMAVETERVDEAGGTKTEGDSFSPDEEKRLVRKLDLWYNRHLPKLAETSLTPPSGCCPS